MRGAKKEEERKDTDRAARAARSARISASTRRSVRVPGARTVPNLSTASTPAPTQTRKAQPKTKKPRGVRSLLANKRLVFASTVAVCTLVSVVIVYAQVQTQKAADADAKAALIENLEYQTVLPATKTISQLGGWRRISPDDKPAVYAYADTIEDVAITVSQQPLPGKFIGDADKQVADLAKAYNATTELSANGMKVFIGTSSKGPQSVIFTKNNLLILIKSQSKISNAAWTGYIKTLD